MYKEVSLDIEKVLSYWISHPAYRMAGSSRVLGQESFFISHVKNKKFILCQITLTTATSWASFITKKNSGASLTSGVPAFTSIWPSLQSTCIRWWLCFHFRSSMRKLQSPTPMEHEHHHSLRTSTYGLVCILFLYDISCCILFYKL